MESEEIWSKIYWALVVIASITLSVYFTIFNYLEFINSGTVTSINTTTASLKDITFPSLILCNVNQVTSSFLKRLDLNESNDTAKKILFNQFLDGVPANETTDEQVLLQLTKKLTDEYVGIFISRWSHFTQCSLFFRAGMILCHFGNWPVKIVPT